MKTLLFKYGRVAIFINSLFVILSSSVWAQSAVCKLDGKIVDRFGPDRATYQGVMTCILEDSAGTTVEKHTFLKGRRIEESIDGPDKKEVNHFFDGNENEWRHGEQLEYFPRTSQLKSRQRYLKMHQVGLQEFFHKNGQLREKTFWVQDREDGGVTQTAGLGYYENGGLQYLKCSNSRATTIDSKLCGFEGKQAVNIVAANRAVVKTIVLEKGVVQASEAEEKVNSKWPTIVERGTLKLGDDVRLKREKFGRGEKLTWTYANGRIKRMSFTDEDNKFLGDDAEYFESGKLARRTKFEKTGPVQSECLWENGKPKAKIERNGNHVDATFIWDTGITESSGKYLITDDSYSRNYGMIDLMISCEERDDVLLKHGFFQLKRRDGTTESEGRYQNGKPVGWQKSFDKLGVIAVEELFAPDASDYSNRIEARKTYESGKIIKEEKFNSDGSIRDTSLAK